MSPSMPAFEAFAVDSASGPHVTPAAGAHACDRYYATTARDSWKARSVRRHRRAAVAVGPDAEGRVRLVAGRAVVLDAVAPLDAAADPIGSWFAWLALGRLGARHVRQVVGYVEAASVVPFAWSPFGRVAVMVRPDHVLRYDDAGIVASRGAWSSSSSWSSSSPWSSSWSASAPRRTWPAASVDVAAPDLSALVADGLPAEMVDLIVSVPGIDTACSVGLTTGVGPVAVPARWDGAVATVRRDVIERLAPEGPVCVTIDVVGGFDDEVGGDRPDQKRGVMLRGDAHFGLADRATVAIVPVIERVTWWHGFESGTVARPPDRLAA